MNMMMQRMLLIGRTLVWFASCPMCAVMYMAILMLYVAIPPVYSISHRVPITVNMGWYIRYLYRVDMQTLVRTLAHTFHRFLPPVRLVYMLTSK